MAFVRLGRATCLAALFALLFAPRWALSNGRPAATSSVLVHPTAPEQIMGGATFGAVFSFDGGSTWQLVCESPLGTTNAAIDPVYRLHPSGTLFQGSQQGLIYSKNGGCDWSRVGGSLANQAVGDVSISPSDPMRVLASSITVAQQNGVHVSTDGGLTFAAPALTATGAFRGVRFATPTRVYAIAYDNTGQTVTRFYRSDDAGGRFVATGYEGAAEGSPNLIGADPRNPDHVYYFARTGGVGQLRRSTDGGASFQTVTGGATYTTIFGGVFATNGTLYLATDQGVRKTTDGITVQPAAPGAFKITCLGIHDQTLYGCAEEFSSGFSIGKSTDEGASWQPLLRMGSNITGPLACANASQECDQCYHLWPTFAMQQGLPNQSAPACMQGPTWGGGQAGGTSGGGGAGSGGSAGSRGGGSCSCAVGGAPDDSVLFSLFLGILALYRLRRRHG